MKPPDEKSLIGLPVAIQKCGGSSPDMTWPGLMAPKLQDYEAYAREFGPIFKRQGYHRVWFEKPGGIFYINQTTGSKNPQGDHREVHANQWQIAQQLGYAYADDEKLEACVRILKEHGVGEVFFYVGSPDVLPDPLVDGLKAVKPFTRLRDILKVSMSFDVMGSDYPDQPPNARYRSAWHRVRTLAFAAELSKMGVGVIPELRPIDYKPWLGIVSGTVSAKRWDRPEARVNAGKLGEIFTVADDGKQEDSIAWAPDETPLIWKFATRHASSVKASAYEGRK